MGMKTVKRIIGFMLIMVLLLQMMCYSVFAVDKTNNSSDEAHPTFQPKIMVQSYEFSKDTIYAGEKVTAKITLLNTSTDVDVKNMMVTAEIDNDYLELTSKTDSKYIPEIPAGKSSIFSYKFKSKASTPSGQYNLNLAMTYADKEGTVYDASGKVKVNIVQKAKVKFDPLIINSEAEIGDTIEAQVNAMNLGRGKAYNVRAEIKADGLTPMGTIYIGDIESGEMGTGTVQVAVGSLTKGDDSYGTTTGTVTYYYESESGKVNKVNKQFLMDIKAFSSNTENVTEENTNQWWIVMAVIVGVICIFVVCGVFLKLRRKSGEKNEMVQ
jgi:hypothetical protein